ncbi:PREDICTED: active regulator of SIRT1 [Nanorana parkeri]|uniref:active regulator of SIRT1 n=1 Tax=Nanorana parkeri TaxID=125878 RepID=UPI0008546918|nr:PREDICTED: active regulator of SIRT1 [Nanorana parkeri]
MEEHQRHRGGNRGTGGTTLECRGTAVFPPAGHRHRSQHAGAPSGEGNGEAVRRREKHSPISARFRPAHLSDVTSVHTAREGFVESRRMVEMSTSLLKKELELVCSDSKDFGKQPAKHKRKEALSTNKTGMKKQLRKLKQGRPQNQRATAKDRDNKPAIEERKKLESQDYLAQNLKYMLGSCSVTNKNVVKKILDQNCGRKAKDQQATKKKRMQQKSVFSDSDFERFEKEYFGRR